MAEDTQRTIRVERKDEARPTDSWLPQSSLPVPAPREGWVHRWVRTSSLGRSDNTNVSRMMREGWVPVEAKDYPELQILSDHNSQFKGNIEVGGLLLCKAPEETMKARQRYYQELSDKQILGVDNSFLREGDPRMPLLAPERSTRTSFGRP
jgi:hypothetical protein